MWLLRFILLVALTFSVATPPASARLQPASTDEPPILLLTIEPGELAWERFGHNALVVDGVAYDWGRFDFGNGLGDLARFIGRFIQGDMPYGFGAAPADAVADFYAAQLGRHVTVTALNLTPDQHERLRALLAVEPSVYGYDYFRANCSTKLRDLLNEAVEGRLEAALRVPTETSYRAEVNRHTAGLPWLWFALDGGFGSKADEPISRWQQTFLPAELEAALHTVRQADGTPLVVGQAGLGPARRPVPDQPPTRVLPMLLIGGTTALLLLATSRWRVGRLLSALLLAATGLLGLLLSYLWLFTSHDYADWNAGVFLLSPLGLPLAGVMGTRRWRLRRWLAAGVGTSLAIGVVLWWGWGQHSGHVAAALLPPQIAALTVAMGAGWPKRGSHDEDGRDDNGVGSGGRGRGAGVGADGG